MTARKRESSDLRCREATNWSNELSAIRYTDCQRSSGCAGSLTDRDNARGMRVVDGRASALGVVVRSPFCEKVLQPLDLFGDQARRVVTQSFQRHERTDCSLPRRSDHGSAHPSRYETRNENAYGSHCHEDGVKQRPCPALNRIAVFHSPLRNRRWQRTNGRVCCGSMSHVVRELERVA